MKMHHAFREESGPVISPQSLRSRGSRGCVPSGTRDALRLRQADHPVSSSRRSPGSEMRAAVCPIAVAMETASAGTPGLSPGLNVDAGGCRRVVKQQVH